MTTVFVFYGVLWPVGLMILGFILPFFLLYKVMKFLGMPK